MAYRTIFILLTLLLASAATANSQSRDDADVTALMRAARDAERGNVTALLDQGVDVNARDSYGWTALIYASAKGDASIVKALVDKGLTLMRKPLTATRRCKPLRTMSINLLLNCY